MKPWVVSPALNKAVVVVCACNPSPWEVKKQEDYNSVLSFDDYLGLHKTLSQNKETDDVKFGHTPNCLEQPIVGLYLWSQ